MKKATLNSPLIFKMGSLALTLCFPFITWSQVGIQTNSPNGALDINSSSNGVVYPSVSLVNINSETISNPNASNLVPGTLVYNESTSSADDSSVYPGLYFWNGSKWVPQFNKRDNQLFYQSNSRRVRATSGDQAVSFNNNVFTPLFSGNYKIVLTFHFGGGEVDPTTSTQFVNFNSEEGVFKFTIDGNTTAFTIKSYSGKNNDRLFKGGSGNPEKNYVDQYNQTSYSIEDTFVANTPYTFSITFNAENAPGFISDGDGGNGRGYITISNNLKCTVEFNYVGE
ncbi:hypothetical protein F3C99_05410 [Vitellibacter sp. q18]|nr:hypothetical protein [Aequorivita lutea]